MKKLFLLFVLLSISLASVAQSAIVPSRRQDMAITVPFYGVTYGTGYQNFSTYRPLSYTKQNGWVTIDGCFQKTSNLVANEAMFTLPISCAGTTTSLYEISVGDASSTHSVHQIQGGNPFLFKFGTLSDRVAMTVNIRYYVSTKTALFFGDSNTNGYGLTTPSTEAYTVKLAALLGYRNDAQGVNGSLLQNTATSGASFSIVNGRNRYTTDLLAHVPDAVFIMYGTNDLRYTDVTITSANYQTQLGEIIQGAIDAGIPRRNIVVGSPPYMTSGNYGLCGCEYSGGTLVIHQAYIAAAAAAAALKGVKYVDTYAVLLAAGGSSQMQADGLHMNATGHTTVSNAFYAAYIAP